MSARPPSEIVKKSKELPLATHTFVLGADIVDHQQANWLHMQGYRSPGGLEGTEIRATGESYISQHERRYIAKWARRNLFEGQP